MGFRHRKLNERRGHSGGRNYGGDGVITFFVEWDYGGYAVIPFGGG